MIAAINYLWEYIPINLKGGNNENQTLVCFFRSSYRDVKRVHYTITQRDGSALPTWLNFDANSLRLSGSPKDGDVGALELLITAKDSANAISQSAFTLIVEAVNDAPVLNNPVSVIYMLVDSSNTYTLPQNVFVDPDINDAITLELKLANGSALPDWLSFDASTLTLSATPNQTQLAAPLQLQLVATDLSGAKTSTLITLAAAIWGSESADTLNGTQVSETLWGLGGNDTITGNAGADKLIGGEGNDTYVADNFDVIIEEINEGIDTVKASSSWVLGENLENLTLTGAIAINGMGNTLANILTGNAAANILDGAAGADTMIGGLGNDIYQIEHLEDLVIERLNEGNDTANVDIATIDGTYVLAANLENASLNNNIAYNLRGNSLDNLLRGNASNNILNGLGGSDT
ncbi:MAG: hypothetical protein B7Y34_01515, partial [Methylophilales bacterium 16-45-9]